MTRTASARAKDKATKLHSILVRARGACENCGSITNLQCAHIVSRRYSATRTRLDNAFCLCAKCHMHFTEWPLEFHAFVVQKIGAVHYERLRYEALVGRTKVDWPLELERLQALAHANA